jgi:SRSO17 transposase
LKGFELGMEAKMDLGSDVRFGCYVEGLASAMGRAGRAGPLRDYCTGLILPGERKSVEPMAARTAPARVSAQHQSLLHFVGAGGWSDEKVLAKISELVVPAITKHGPIEVWIIDDTGLPKKGRHSVGVKSQYCGQLGKEANCQVAVSLSIANHFASLPVGYRLYLPNEWAEDRSRRDRAGVPEDIRFKTKQQIALELIQRAHAAGLAPGVLLMDLDYGRDSRLRKNVSALGLSYVAGIQPKVLMWKPGTGPKRPDRSLNNNGRRGEPDLISAQEIARDLPKHAWRTIRWREGSADWLSSRFARVRVRVGYNGAVPGQVAEEWLLIEWPEGETQLSKCKYWLSTLPAEISFEQLVDIAKMRWRIERDYQELKQEVGLGHYEGRGWRGFHHHATLCIAAYGFLVSERAAISPSGPDCPALLSTPALPDGYRPRGSAIAA